MMKGYEANIETEWQPLSKQHEKHLENLDKILTAYVNGNTRIPSIAVVGPYGQGKTQLLFHILARALTRKTQLILSCQVYARLLPVGADRSIELVPRASFTGAFTPSSHDLHVSVNFLIGLVTSIV